MIETERLILRSWKDSDLEPFARLNADPQAMEFMLNPLSREESDAWVERMKTHFAGHGFSHYAAELKQDGSFVGAIGLSVPAYETPFSPCVEIGWRILPAYWNRGLATEGAREVLRYAFEVLRLPEIVAFTVPANHRSRRVMEKIGMVRDLTGDFDHPRVPVRHPLRRHMLYRWKGSRAGASAIDTAVPFVKRRRNG
jgi:RimJ/RimL family protein N-acetyltransferase